MDIARAALGVLGAVAFFYAMTQYCFAAFAETSEVLTASRYRRAAHGFLWSALLTAAVNQFLSQ